MSLNFGSNFSYMHVLINFTPWKQFTSFFSYFSNFLVRDFTGGGSWFNKIPIVGNMFRYIPHSIFRPMIHEI